jgi:ketopantoate reductase
MRAPVVIVGLGQLGAVFAEAFLRLGRPVVPVLRGQSVTEVLGAGSAAPEPELVLVAVGEDDLAAALASVPVALRDRVVLLQNELRPAQWRRAGITSPTLAIVWFEKKPGAPLSEVRPTVVAGPHAALVAAALEKVGVHATVRPEAIDDPAVAHELVLKNLYILGLNLTGLATGGTAGEMLGEHSERFRTVVDELFELEAELLESADDELSRDSLDRERLDRELREALLADPEHGASGRSAPRRLERSLEHSRTVGLRLEHLEDLARGLRGK